MDDDKVKFKKKLVAIGGGSTGLVIPLALCNYLEAKPGDEIILTSQNGQYGKYIAFWKNNEEKIN